MHHEGRTFSSRHTAGSDQGNYARGPTRYRRYSFEPTARLSGPGYRHAEIDRFSGAYGSAPQFTGAGTLARRSVIHCCESTAEGKKARSCVPTMPDIGGSDPSTWNCTGVP